jgi:hypothetical protein
MTEFIERARAILHDNDLGGYTVPTKRLYPFQWNWDRLRGPGFSTPTSRAPGRSSTHVSSKEEAAHHPTKYSDLPGRAWRH